MEAAADPAGDLLPPPTERPELFSGGKGHHCIIKEKKRFFFPFYPLNVQLYISVESEGLIGQV